jgi:predicted metal-dependent hydrolase
MQQTLKTITIGERKVEYRLRSSKTSQKLRVRIGLDGVEIIQPAGRDTQELNAFLESNRHWILNQLERVDHLRSIRKPLTIKKGEILYRGATTPVVVENIARRKTSNKVIFENGTLTIVRGLTSSTPPALTLEHWLRLQAKQAIDSHLTFLTEKLGAYPNKVYIMEQKTKWGNCSALQNLSFNWRLILAPDFVLSYIVTHEVVHLEVPDHSKRFWLAVQSLCPTMDRAKQWLAANSEQLKVNIRAIC